MRRGIGIVFNEVMLTVSIAANVGSQETPWAEAPALRRPHHSVFQKVTTEAYVGCSNVAFRDLTFEGRPHWIAANPPNLDAIWEDGCLYPTDDAGVLIACRGNSAAGRNVNILFTNCVFRNAGIDAIDFIFYNSNIVVRSCEVYERDKGTNGALIGRTTTPSVTTSNFFYTSASIFGRPAGAENVLIMDNSYNGGPGMTNVNSDYAGVNAADGFVWGQTAGNWFVARNSITNYSLEAVQFNAGPAGVAGNALDTRVSLYACEALFASAVWVGGSPTLSPADNVYGFVGNRIIGGRAGLRGEQAGSSATSYQVDFCGNTLDLHPAFQRDDDYPGAAISAEWVGLANISGNTVYRGGGGVRWLNNCTNAIILKNAFTNLTFRALSCDGTNGLAGSVAMLKNLLSQGGSYHLKVRSGETGNYFLWQNAYYPSNGVTAINAVVDYPGAAIHLNP